MTSLRLEAMSEPFLCDQTPGHQPWDYRTLWPHKTFISAYSGFLFRRQESKATGIYRT